MSKLITILGLFAVISSSAAAVTSEQLAVVGRMLKTEFVGRAQNLREDSRILAWASNKLNKATVSLPANFFGIAFDDGKLEYNCVAGVRIEGTKTSVTTTSCSIESMAPLGGIGDASFDN